MPILSGCLVWRDLGDWRATKQEQEPSVLCCLMRSNIYRADRSVAVRWPVAVQFLQHNCRNNDSHPRSPNEVWVSEHSIHIMRQGCKISTGSIFFFLVPISILYEGEIGSFFIDDLENNSHFCCIQNINHMVSVTYIKKNELTKLAVEFLILVVHISAYMHYMQYISPIIRLVI